jgi:hypothetical protein
MYLGAKAVLRGVEGSTAGVVEVRATGGRTKAPSCSAVTGSIVCERSMGGTRVSGAGATGRRPAAAPETAARSASRKKSSKDMRSIGLRLRRLRMRSCRSSGTGVALYAGVEVTRPVVGSVVVEAGLSSGKRMRSSPRSMRRRSSTWFWARKGGRPVAIS